MAPKSRFARLDAFAKTVEDARVRTRSGGVVTLVSLLTIIFLIWAEWKDFRKVVVMPELIVDKSRGERMEIHLNMSFPVLPCELLTLDVMDVSGEQQTGVIHGINKVRLASVSEGSRVIESTQLELKSPVTTPQNDQNYCGPCYGAPPPATASKQGCCNTCDDVREAYAVKGWFFGKGEAVEQCIREGYSEKIEAQRKEGCRIEGVLRVNKVIGNFHIAPGRSFTSGMAHGHILDNYYVTPEQHTMTHTIHQLRFGPQLPDSLSSRWKWTDHHHTNPLDGTSQKAPDARFNFMYFVKVVSTAYLPLGVDATTSSDLHHRDAHNTPLGKHGIAGPGSIETHQYSVTSHRRSVDGGSDAAEGHKERLHAQGGIPGVFFQYDISPMKVINREARPKTFAGFLAGICAVVGGTLTVAAALDRMVYEGAVRVKKLHTS